MKKVYLNGRFLAPEDAKVSVFDRGFIFGDGVYEVIPAYGGRAFRLDHHLRRLQRNLGAIGLPEPMTRQQWLDTLASLLEDNQAIDQSLYIQVTRGVAPRDHGFPASATPTVFAYAQPLSTADRKLLEHGVAAVTTPDIRWQRCDIKAIALLANVMFRQFALEQGAMEAILVRDGMVTEGAASNIFIVRGGVVKTPPKGEYILPGITRDLVLELARGHQVACAETAFTDSELLGADEVWMTSSMKEILPITRVDGGAIGGGKPGPVFTRMYGIYQNYKEQFRAGKVH